MTPNRVRIGFVSTRLKGTDGVSLEVRKWAEVLTGLGQHDASSLPVKATGRPIDRTWCRKRTSVIPTILHLNADLFDDYIRTPVNVAAHRRVEDVISRPTCTASSSSTLSSC